MRRRDYLTLPKKVLTEAEKKLLTINRKKCLPWIEKTPYRGWKKVLTLPEKKVLDICNNPVRLMEKLQWSKVYDHNPLYTRLADKAEVKEYVAERISAAHVIPTLGVYDRWEDINLHYSDFYTLQYLLLNPL